MNPRSDKQHNEARAQLQLVAAFIQLEQTGAIGLSLATQKMLFIGAETVRVTHLKGSASNALGRAILSHISGDASKDTAKGIVYRLLGQDATEPDTLLRSWTQAEELSAEAAQALLTQAIQKNAALYKRLQQDVLDGLRARLKDERESDA